MTPQAALSLWRKPPVNLGKVLFINLYGGEVVTIKIYYYISIRRISVDQIDCSQLAAMKMVVLCTLVGGRGKKGD